MTLVYNTIVLVVQASSNRKCLNFVFCCFLLNPLQSQTLHLAIRNPAFHFSNNVKCITSDRSKSLLIPSTCKLKIVYMGHSSFNKVKWMTFGLINTPETFCKFLNESLYGWYPYDSIYFCLLIIVAAIKLLNRNCNNWEKCALCLLFFHNNNRLFYSVL